MASMLEACRANQGLPAKLTAGSRVGYDLSKVGAGASRGFSGKKKLEAAAWSGTWPAPGATLDLDFTNNRGFVRGMGQGGVMDGITFTRASNATYVGEDGLLKGGGNALGKNLLAFPQDFDNAAWAKSGTTAIPNAESAPDKTLTADLLAATASTEVHYIQSTSIAFTISTTYAFSFYVKKSTNDFVQVLFGSAAFGLQSFANFDIVSGTVGSVGTNATASIEDAGSGWYRCIVSAPATATASSVAVFAVVQSSSSPRFPSFTATGTESIFIWGAQLELGTEATEYFPTNINVPRFDWASASQAAANVAGYTEDFGGAYWRAVNSAEKGALNSTIAPDGTNSADQININTGNFYSGFVSPIFGTYTFSCHYKGTAGQRVKLAIYQANGTFVFSTFELTGGWDRFSITTTIGVINFYVADHRQPPSNAATSFYAWGAQLEIGDSATSYKANTGAFTATNTPLSANPACNGLLIEEARTNRLLWCRDATQTQWVKTDITAAKDQTGIDGVANAASSLTATADGGTCIQTITLASGSRTGSVYLKRITGTSIVQVSLDGSTWSTVDLSDTEWRRIVLSGTVTNPVVGIRLATSGDAVAMDFGQVEDGLFATSPILTTTATATRAVELPKVQGANFSLFDQGKSTLFCSFVSHIPDGSTQGTSFISIDNNNGGGTVSYCSFGRANYDTGYRISSNSGSVGYFTAMRFNQTNACISLTANGCISSSNGSRESIFPASAVLRPVQLAIGHLGPNFNVMTGTVKRIVYSPQFLSGPAIQNLTGDAA